MTQLDDLLEALEAWYEVNGVDARGTGEDLVDAYRAFKAAPNPVAELQADNERLAKYARGWHDGHRKGLERAAEIAETDTFAPPYGKRIADAIRAGIDK